MRRPTQPTDATGFTIVEMMFVVATAGLILVIVLMAIPALMRNSRNNQRRQDVNTVLQAVSHYELNNSGTVPDTAALQGILNAANHHLTAYDATAVTVTPTALGQGSAPVNDTDGDHIHVYNHAKCDPDNPGNPTPAGAGYNDVVALFSVESSGGTSHQCQQL